MKTIHKYPVEIKKENIIPMPKGAQVLTVQLQNGLPYVWALVDPKAPQVNRSIEIYGTGHDIPDIETVRLYIGTFQSSGGIFVFHVFERFIPC